MSFSASNTRMTSMPFSMAFLAEIPRRHRRHSACSPAGSVRAGASAASCWAYGPFSACAGAPTGPRSESAGRRQTSRRPSTPATSSPPCPGCSHAGSISSDPHARGSLRLMRVAEDGICYSQSDIFLFHNGHTSLSAEQGDEHACRDRGADDTRPHSGPIACISRKLLRDRSRWPTFCDTLRRHRAQPKHRPSRSAG